MNIRWEIGKTKVPITWTLLLGYVQPDLCSTIDPTFLEKISMVCMVQYMLQLLTLGTIGCRFENLNRLGENK